MIQIWLKPLMNCVMNAKGCSQAWSTISWSRIAADRTKADMSRSWLPVSCQRAPARQQFRLYGLVKKRTAVEVDQPNPNGPLAGGQLGVREALTKLTGSKLVNMNRRLLCRVLHGFFTILSMNGFWKPAGKWPAACGQLKRAAMNDTTASMICLEVDFSIESAAENFSAVEWPETPRRITHS